MDIYVGNLAYKSTDEDLRTLFAQYGEVTSARVVVDRGSGRSKGFGFVEMPNAEEAQKAIDAINGNDFQGRALRVNESQPKPREPRSFGGPRGSYGGPRGGYGGGIRRSNRRDDDRW